MKYILSFILWIFTTILIFFWYNQFDINIQKLSDNNVNFQGLVENKINELRNWIKNISWKNIQNDEKLEKINEITEILNKWYIYSNYISWTKMWEAAMQAYVSALWDPFTGYLTSEDNKSLYKELKWTSDFEGIGAVVTKVPEGIMVEKIIKDGPAFKVGIKPLDIILKADNIDLLELPLWEWVSKIKWPKWTNVDLMIKRDGKIININVTRDKVELKSVESKFLNYKNKKLWYISISTVWEDTYNQFLKQIKELLSLDIKWIIIDLRWNGGWYLDIWYTIWSMWAKKWDIIVQTKYKDSSDDKVFKAEEKGILNNFPTVVLVDDYTASAWEIITAAIKNNNKNSTKILWIQTFWKWTIQTIKEFKDGSSLKYTIWKWYTPDNKNLSDGIKPWNGIKPDIEIKFDGELYKTKHIDNQFEEAKKALINIINK